MLKNLLLCCFFVGFCHAYQLEDAISDSLKKNHSILAATEQIKSARLASKIPLAEFMPTVSLIVGIDPVTSSHPAVISSNGSLQQLPNPNFTLQLQQNLFSFGRSTTKLKKAYYDYKTRELSSYSEINGTVLSVVAVYLEMLKANETVKLYEDILSATTKHFDAERRKFQLGEASKSDIAKAQSRLSSTKAQRIQALSNQRNVAERFTHLIGRQPENLSYPKIAADKIPSSFIEALEIAKKNNLNLKIAYSNKKSTELARTNEMLNIAPSLDLRAQFTYGSKNGAESSMEQISKSVALNLTMPIFQGGREYVGMAAAHSVLMQADEKYKNAHKNLLEELTIAWNEYRNFSPIIDATNDVIKANQISLDATKEEAKLNVKTNLDIIDAEIDLLRSKIQLITDKNAQLNAFYRILSIMEGARITAV